MARTNYTYEKRHKELAKKKKKEEKRQKKLERKRGNEDELLTDEVTEESEVDTDEESED